MSLESGDSSSCSFWGSPPPSLPFQEDPSLPSVGSTSKPCISTNTSSPLHFWGAGVRPFPPQPACLLSPPPGAAMSRQESQPVPHRGPHGASSQAIFSKPPSLGFKRREAPLLAPWLGEGDPSIPRPLSQSSGATGLFHCQPGLSSPSPVAGGGDGLTPAGPFALLYLQVLPGGSQVKSNFQKNCKNSQEFRAGPGLGGMLGDSLRQGCVQTSSDCPARFLCLSLKRSQGLWLGPTCNTRGTTVRPASWEGRRQGRASLRLPQALGSAR